MVGHFGGKEINIVVYNPETGRKPLFSNGNYKSPSKRLEMFQLSLRSFSCGQ